jgi:glycosyltransferase involved in cell wall biosynthesis
VNRLRVAYETTALEMDGTGAARAITMLEQGLRADPRVDLVRLAQPDRGPRSPVARGLVRELAWFPIELPRRAQAAGADLLHCPVALAPARRGAVPVVVSVNDVMPLSRPEWFTRRNVWHTKLLLGRMLRAAAGVLTCSEHSRGEILAAFDLDPERVVVTYYGVDERFAPGPRPETLLERLGVGDSPYLLTVGKLQPRKNVEAAIRAVERLRHDHRLVIAGARGWRDAELLELVRASPAAERIHLAGLLSDDDLVGLYRGAAVFVFPSLHEGFGFPPLEAMACGTPVVCSDRTSLPEVVGDAGLLVDPDDDAALAAAVALVLEEPGRAEDLRRRALERAAGFTWERCVDATVAAYERFSG